MSTDLHPEARAFLSKIGKKGGQIGGAVKGRKGFAAIDPKHHAEIVAASVAARKRIRDQKNPTEQSEQS